MKKHLIPIAIVLVTTACTSTLTRYKWMGKTKTDNSIVTMSVATSSVSPISESKPYKSVFDLTDEGQKAVLNAKSNDEINTFLNKKYLLEQEKKGATTDLSSRTIRVTFSIARPVSYDKKNKFTAFDRIENLKYKFTLNNGVDADMIFNKWNKYTTEYGTLDIGTLEYNQSFTANLGLGAKVGASTSGKDTKKIDENNSSERSYSIGPEISATASAGGSRSRKETQIIKDYYIQLTGTFNNKDFEIHQQGSPQTRIEGNVSAEITVKLPKQESWISSFSNLFDEAGLPNDQSKVKFEANRYFLPDGSKLTGGIYGKLDYEYAVRHVKRGRKTSYESDDHINYYTGNNTANVTLMKKEDLVVPTWFIKFENGTGSPPSLTYDIGGPKNTIQFLSFEQALEFKNWLRSQIPSLAALKISGKTISFEGLDVFDSTVKADLDKIKIAVAN